MPLESERPELDPRRVTIELLEERAINRNLDRQLRKTEKQLTELNNERQTLQRSNAILRKDRADLKVLHKRVEREARRQSQALTKTTVLLNSEREIRMHAEKELNRCQNLLRKYEASKRASILDPDIEQVTGPTQLELVASVRNTLTGTVSTWVRNMQAEHSPGIKEAEVLSWLLHKVFFLCAELIEERREELISVFRGKQTDGCDDGKLDPPTAAFMHQHMCRHYLTLFPLTGEELQNAHDKIASSLARDIMDSTEWDWRQRDSGEVVEALLSGGFSTIVPDYLSIMVSCCLQDPPITFTDDIGKVQRYNSDIHAKPIDGRKPAGDRCIVVFPSLVVAGEWGNHQPFHPRYVLCKSG